MSVILWICIGILIVAIVLGLIRALTARESGSRAIVGDLVYFATVGILVSIGMLVNLSIVIDVLFLSSLLGVLATVALSRILTRGHR